MIAERLGRNSVAASQGHGGGDVNRRISKSIGPTNYRTSSPGWSDVLKLLVVVIVADKTGRFRLPPMVRVYVEMKPRDVAA
jgi:hypothetical protein